MVISATGSAISPSADHEPDRAAAIVARHAVHALTDQLGDQHGFGKGREQLVSRLRLPAAM